jgi:hypothetical protein
MRVAPCYNERFYWSHNEILGLSLVNEIITKDLFYGIKKFLSFSTEEGIKYDIDEEESEEVSEEEIYPEQPIVKKKKPAE